MQRWQRVFGSAPLAATVSIATAQTSKAQSTVELEDSQNLGMDFAKLPKYPPDARAKRVLSIVFYQGTFDRVSKSARIKARIKLIRSTDDGQFELLEVLAVPPQ